MKELPSAWTVALGERPPPNEATLVDLTAQRRDRSLAVTFFERGAEAFDLKFPIGPAVVLLPAFPTLDDVWTLYMLAQCERDEGVREARPKSWEVISNYAEQVRQGFVPERVTPERSVQAILRSISTATLPKQGERFVADAMKLCDVIAKKVEAGAKLLEDDLVTGEAWLQKHVAFLQEDARVYREDRSRGRRYTCEITAREGAAARTLPLLVIPKPLSQMFKLWARRDEGSPDGNGYALLLTQDEAGEIVLSLDPTRRGAIGWLAKGLDEAEKKKGGSGKWYDGGRHEGTLVGSPKGGTKLSLDDVVAAIGREMKLTEVRTARVRPPWVMPAMAAVGIAVIAILIGRSSLVTHSEKPHESGHSMDYDPIPATEKSKPFSLLDPKAGITSFTHYAIILGVCSYGPKTGTLAQSCNNAWQFAHVLVESYHYPPENVFLLIDDSSKVDPRDWPNGPALTLKPEKDVVLKLLQDWKNQHRENERATLVFYYSGHGFVDGPDLPYLLLANWEKVDGGAPIPGIDGLNMKEIVPIVKGKTGASHILYLFDNCHAGWAVGMGEGEPEDIQKKWDQGISYGIAASKSDQRAWEKDAPPGKGMSVFTRALVKGLRIDSNGEAEADTKDGCGSKDHIVTHAELEAYLRREVPPAAKELEGAVQEPVGRRLDGETKGQFLFVAPKAEDYLKTRECKKSIVDRILAK